MIPATENNDSAGGIDEQALAWVRICVMIVNFCIGITRKIIVRSHWLNFAIILSLSPQKTACCRFY